MSAKSGAAPRSLSEYRRKPGASVLPLSRSQTATCCATRLPQYRTGGDRAGGAALEGVPRRGPRARRSAVDDDDAVRGRDPRARVRSRPCRAALQPQCPIYRRCCPRQRSAKRLGRMRSRPHSVLGGGEADGALYRQAAKSPGECHRHRTRSREHSDRHSDRLTEHDKGPSCLPACLVLAAAACRARDDPGGGSRVAACRFSDAALG
jgi:hypothetical protein